MDVATQTSGIDDLRTLLREFVNRYQGLPLSITTTGGGVSLNLIPTLTGSSKVFNSGLVPYGSSAIDAFVEHQGVKAVSREMAQLYYSVSVARAREPLCHVVVTAALLTNRQPRRPQYEAFVCIDGAHWHVTFPTPDPVEYSELEAKGDLDELRSRQDASISAWVISVLLGDSNGQHQALFVDGMKVKRL